MKKMMMIGIASALVCAATVSAFAANAAKTPAQTAADLTGKTVEEVVAERQETGKTFGQMADDAGKLTEFLQERLEARKEVLQTRVEEGRITQEQADTAVEQMAQSQANADTLASCGYLHANGVCDGSCQGGDSVAGCGYLHANGVCDGSCQGNGVCDGSGMGGQGQGAGMGQGSGACDGTGMGGGQGHGMGGGHHGGRG